MSDAADLEMILVGMLIGFGLLCVLVMAAQLYKEGGHRRR
jgi:hypothetical protein